MDDKLSEQQVRDAVLQIAAENAGMNVDAVSLDARFEGDLGYDSLQMAEFIMAIEEHFGIDIADDHVEDVRTVGEALAMLTRLLPATSAGPAAGG